MTNKSLGTFINPFTDARLREIDAEAHFKLNELANTSYEDRHAYELSLKYYRDFVNVLDTAKKEGIELGREEGLAEEKWLERINLAKAMLDEGLSIETVMKITGLSEADVLK
jgi:predicted transposase/invertase (TIGR01784 family)